LIKEEAIGEVAIIVTGTVAFVASHQSPSIKNIHSVIPKQEQSCQKESLFLHFRDDLKKE
jgi:hypothetical protein